MPRTTPQRKSKKKDARGPRPVRRSSGFSATWESDGAWVAEGKRSTRRHYQIGTLTSALAAAAENGTGIFVSGSKTSGRRSALNRIQGRLIVETESTLEWLLRTHGSDGRTATLRLVVAKDDDTCGKYVKETFQALQRFETCAPKLLPHPLRSGFLLLPERRPSTSKHRRIPAYITTPFPDSHPCTIDKSGQFTLHTPKRKLLPLAHSDAVKRRLIELCLKTYVDSHAGALAPPDPRKAEIRLKVSGRRAPEVFVTGSPHRWTRLDGPKLLHRISGHDWTEGGAAIPLLPSDLSLLRQALDNVLGKRQALAMLRDYLAAIEYGRFTAHHRLPRKAIAHLAEVPPR